MSRPAFELAGIFQQYGEAFRDHSLPLQQLRVMRAIEVCRTAALGGHVETCGQCDFTRIAYNSCRNRHCPKCQNAERARWLEGRKAELLPVEYFHVVFTIPEQLARIAFHNQEVVYGILFHAASETLLTIARDPQHLGAEIGFFAILHTWGQNLLHHPHVHCVVPGGGLSPDTIAGSAASRASSSPCVYFRACSAVFSSRPWRMPFIRASSVSSGKPKRCGKASLWPIAWLRWRSANGWSMPNLPSGVRGRFLKHLTYGSFFTSPTCGGARLRNDNSLILRLRHDVENRPKTSNLSDREDAAMLRQRCTGKCRC